MNFFNYLKGRIIYFFGSPFFLSLINYKKKIAPVFKNLNKIDKEENKKINYWNEKNWRQKRIDLRQEKINSEYKSDSHVTCYALLPLTLNSFFKKDQIKILDWGGGDGLDYFRMKDNILNNNLEYYVFDSHFSETKKNEELIKKNSNNKIFFTKQPFQTINFDVIYTSSVFQYCPNYKEILKDFIKNNPKFIFLMRLWCSNNLNDLYRIETYTNQKVVIISFKLLNIFFNENGYELAFKGISSKKNIKSLENINLEIKEKIYGDMNIIFQRK